MKPRLLIVLFSALVGACAVPALKVPVADLGASAPLQVIDLRPAAEKESQLFGALPMTTGFGISRIGEARLEPTPLRLLQHRAFESLGAAGEPPTLKVHHLVVYQNIAVAAVRMAFATAARVPTSNATGAPDRDAPVALSVTIDRAKFDALAADDEWKRGTYNRARENPTDAPTLIVFVDTEIGARRASTRTLYKTTMNEIGGALPKALEAALEFHLAQHRP